MNNISIALELLLILKTQKRISKKELAQRLNISTKMVQRLKNQLQLVGYNILEFNGRYGGYELVDSSFFPFPNLTFEQLNALKKAYSFIISLNHPFINNDFLLAYQKIIANNKILTSEITHINKSHSAIDFNQLNNYINIINNAVIKKKRISISYMNINKNASINYILEPYYLFVIDNNWYMIAIKKFDSMARTYKLDRIQSLSLLEEVYFEQNINIGTFVNEFGFKIDPEFRIKLEINNANYLKEMIISENQVITLIDDNKFIFEGTFYNKKSVQAFVSTYCSNIKVISPIWLKEHHLLLAKNILNNYE